MKIFWKFLTSLRLTVVLLALSVLIIFFGTLSQVDEGLWKSQKIWFESWFVIGQHLRLFGLEFLVPLFPGGYLVGSVLLAALIAAFIHRFTWRWDKLGIHLTHAGVILLLLGQFLTQEFSQESYIGVEEGQTKNYAEHHRRNELAFSRDTGDGQEEVVVIPESMIKPGAEIRHEKLPFTVRIKEYGVNAQLRPRGPMVDGPAKATQGIGKLVVVEPETELTDMNSRNAPYAYVELLDGNKSLGTWLVSSQMGSNGIAPQTIEVAGQKMRIELRFERYYEPFSMTLLETSHDIYPGTTIAKNYRSRVRVVDAATREAREMDIYMNHPLRYAGLTIYQSGMDPSPENPRVYLSTLEAVRNPSWLAPYMGVYVVAFGMYLQFRHHLLKFLGKRLGLTGLKPWQKVLGLLLEVGCVGYPVLKFTSYLFGYSI